MRQQAVFAVVIDGTDITARIEKILQSISTQDRAGVSADQASIIIDDSEGNLIFPKENALCSISLGFKGKGIAQVFVGKIDEVRSKGGRGGRTIHITAKGIDTASRLKEPQNRNFDDLSIKEMLVAAGQPAGITDIRVDDDLAGIVREYEHMDNESFIAFGERLAREIGGTFKIRDNIAVMALMNSGRTPTGAPLPVIEAVYAENLHDWDIAPYIGRHRYAKIIVRFYDKATAQWDQVEVDTGIEGSEAAATGRFEAEDKAAAENKANELKAMSQKKSGAGTVTLEGEVMAASEAECLVIGARGGADGSYKINSVKHVYNRGSGFITTLDLNYPT